MLLKRALFAVALLVVIFLGFVGTLFVLDNYVTPSGPDLWQSAMGSEKPRWSLAPRQGQLSVGAGASVRARADGVEILSRFDLSKANSMDGAAYYMIPSQTSVLAGGKAIVALDVTAENNHRMEVHVIQNGLKAGGWQTLDARSGRHIYKVTYEAAPETRSGEKVDSVWIRSDAGGGGQPLVLHELRIYVK